MIDYATTIIVYVRCLGSVAMSRGGRKNQQRSAANTAEVASMSTNERILRECLELYMNEERGKDLAPPTLMTLLTPPLLPPLLPPPLSFLLLSPTLPLTLPSLRSGGVW